MYVQNQTKKMAKKAIIDCTQAQTKLQWLSFSLGLANGGSDRLAGS